MSTERSPAPEVSPGSAPAGSSNLVAIRPGDWIVFILVQIYLCVVLVWLRLTRQVAPKVSLWRLIVGRYRPRVRGVLREIRHERGHCSVAELDGHLPSDAEGHSRLVLCENGRPLGPAHTLHDRIRELGGGGYSHWGNRIYFSSSDNSDPSSNGRSYSYIA